MFWFPSKTKVPNARASAKIIHEALKDEMIDEKDGRNSSTLQNVLLAKRAALKFKKQIDSRQNREKSNSNQSLDNASYYSDEEKDNMSCTSSDESEEGVHLNLVYTRKAQKVFDYSILGNDFEDSALYKTRDERNNGFASRIFGSLRKFALEIVTKIGLISDYQHDDHLAFPEIYSMVDII